ncbi:MAG: DUF1643 domain-containing protein [Pseudomonadales bacterium]|nr:DUF1643 domain-containing protein [Pseudomonadales bacterium]NRA18122.1 DUF1643 domain-containing protein [Oceanospirillaceae bacterium]
MKSAAEFSACRKYRYVLWRTWDETLPLVMIIGLNPSTADAVNNDPTITRCINFAKTWGYGGLCMTNLFAYRATDPKVMKAQTEPIGVDNDFWLKKLAEDADKVIAAWGNNGSYLNRSASVSNMFGNLYCIGVNKSGEPEHPLYIKADRRPIKF